MEPPFNRPVSVVTCQAIVRLAAHLVPSSNRESWRQEWSAEIWHRWQFLQHAGAWSAAEQLRLLRSCLGVFPDAAWHFGSQENVQLRFREAARSPWTCLGGLAASFLLFALITGIPATREILSPAAVANFNHVALVWEQPFGGRDYGLPSDVVSGWRKSTHSLASLTAFNVSHAYVRTHESSGLNFRIVTADAFFPQVFGLSIPSRAGRNTLVAIDDRTWSSVFHRNPRIVGTRITIANRTYAIAAVLPPRFHFLSRQPSIFIIEPELTDRRSLALARIRNSPSLRQLEHEGDKAVRDASYYFLNSKIRVMPIATVLLTPFNLFGISALVSGLLTLAVCRVRLRHIRVALTTGQRSATMRRCAFFSAKLLFTLSLVFAAGLEWSRPQSSILLAWTDGGSGPFLVWFYVLGSMAAFFWALADQRARCRVCLRLLCFPVRIGCPGCLLLDWSGTELLCSEGHGVLHVPHLATSWDEESDRWINLDESWRGLFAGRTNG